MSDQIRKLAPEELWNHFADLNAIPRPSKKEQKVIQFIKSFGESLKLETTIDEAGNVIIKKPASKGMEHKVTVVLQSHLDMVHQKNADTNFNFDKQGIDMFVDGDWVKAKGTTLGADNGIGVAAIMSLLASSDIPHPAMEALFTIDEETGMTGALALKSGLLKGEILLNLDTEEDNELTIGCAGGVDVTCTGVYQQETPEDNMAFRIAVKGLTGGHSGVDIHKGRANANKLMNRLLWNLSNDFAIGVAMIDGGSLRNAIPRESIADIVVADNRAGDFKKAIGDYNTLVKAEYNYTDPNLTVTIDSIETPPKILEADFKYKILRSIYSCPNGIYRMSPDIASLVQSSNNIARVVVKDGNYSVQCLTRSSVDTEKTDLANAITCSFELAGAAISLGGSYPGWQPKPASPIVKLMSDLYKEMYNEPAHVDAIHAGLECGIIGSHYPDMQMISFGPNIYGAHSPDEKAQISSVQKFWNFLLETLKRIPSKN